MDNKRILLIEDDQFTRELYAEIISESGFEVETAIDGEEGLAKIRSGGFDLIFLDVMMPRMDGLDVLRALTNDPPQVESGPITLLTNLTNDPITKAAMGLNVKDHLVKSDITPGDLINYIKKKLKITDEEKP